MPNIIVGLEANMHNYVEQAKKLVLLSTLSVSLKLIILDYKRSKGHMIVLAS